MPRLAPPAVLAALMAALVAPPAHAYSARNKLTVFATSDPQVMEVVGRSGSAGPDFFCAAGEFARGPLGARASDRLVIVEPVSRSARFNGRRSLLMAVVPRGTPLPRPTGLVLDPSHVGENLSVAHARFLCNSLTRDRGRRGLFD